MGGRMGGRNRRRIKSFGEAPRFGEAKKDQIPDMWQKGVALYGEKGQKRIKFLTCGKKGLRYTGRRVCTFSQYGHQEDESL